jgi:hypothetical protein
MDIRFDCDFSLSKKLRAVIESNDARAVIIIDKIENGIGKGTLLLSGDKLNLHNADKLNRTETSVQFTPNNIVDEIPPEHTVQNIFSTEDLKTTSRPNYIDKLAVRHAPEKEEVPYAVKSKSEIVTPKEFKEYNNPNFRQFVSNVQELMEEVSIAKDKTSNIDLDSITNPREKAVAIEMKEREEAIKIPAYIVNDSCAFIRINDMDISLGLNMPFDLSKISAKRIYASNDLKHVLDKKMVKIISQDQIQSYLSKISQEDPYKQGLEVYGDKDSA